MAYTNCEFHTGCLLAVTGFRSPSPTNTTTTRILTF
jgi:hypothetical protein